jgi:hypothetical protein
VNPRLIGTPRRAEERTDDKEGKDVQMSISAIGSNQAVASILPRKDGDADDVTPASGILPSATTTTVSPQGGLFGQLAELAKTNPDQFKEAATQIAQKLKDEAGQATGGKAAFLSGLADKFSQAAQTGDARGLQPGKARGHHHGHHHHRGGGSEASGTGQGGTESVAQVIQQALQAVTGTAAASASGAAAVTPATPQVAPATT